MRGRNWWIVLAATGMLVAGGCTNNDVLDNGEGPDVVFEISSLQNQPVAGQREEDGICEGDGVTPCSDVVDCSIVGGECVGSTCELRVRDWTGTARNQPLSEPAGSGAPFQDVILETVTIEYDWVSGATTPTREVGLGDVAIPAGGSNTFSFSPISFEDLNDLQGQTGGIAATANLTLTFHAQVVEGESFTSVTRVVERQLLVESCN